VLYHLKQINQHYHTITDDDINRAAIKEINHRLLLIFTDKLIDFKKLLQSSCAVISGSFIIQCLLGEHWNDSDIDIFVPTKGVHFATHYHNEYTDIENMLYNMKLPRIYESERVYTHKPPSVNNVRMYASVQDVRHTKNYHTMSYSESIKLFSFLNIARKQGEYNVDYLIRCDKAYEEHVYGNKMRKIQIIQVDVEPTYQHMVDYIQSSFDFDLCKNIYAINTQEILTIGQLNQVMNKKTSIDMDNLDHRSKERRVRYETRGFKF
jgi:hypothetical protein